MNVLIAEERVRIPCINVFCHRDESENRYEHLLRILIGGINFSI